MTKKSFEEYLKEEDSANERIQKGFEKRFYLNSEPENIFKDLARFPLQVIGSVFSLTFSLGQNTAKYLVAIPRYLFQRG